MGLFGTGWNSIVAERESATFDLLSLANISIAKCVDQIYLTFVPPNDRLMREPDCEELAVPSDGSSRQKLD